MDQKKNNLSLAFGIPGIILQAGSFCLSGAISSATGGSPELMAVVVLGGVVIGTGLLIIGLAFYAEAKGQSAAWCLMGFLGIIGLIVLASLPDRHDRDRRLRRHKGRIADLPTEQSLGFYCTGCNYQLNGTVGTSCPECGRSFDPEDLTTVKVEGLEPKKAPWMGRWSLITGIIGIVLSITFFCGPILGIISVSFGHTAMNTIKRDNLPGRGVAKAGLITGYIAISLSLLILFMAFILPLFAQSVTR